MHTQHINFHLVSTSLILLKIDENCSRVFLKCSGQVYLVPPRNTGRGYGRTSVTTHPIWEQVWFHNHPGQVIAMGVRYREKAEGSFWIATAPESQKLRVPESRTILISFRLSFRNCNSFFYNREIFFYFLDQSSNVWNLFISGPKILIDNYTRTPGKFSAKEELVNPGFLMFT